MRDERELVVEAIRAFLDGSSDQWDWGVFTSSPLRSARLNDIRRRAGSVNLPLDARGEALLRTLLDDAEQLTADGRPKSKAWRMESGALGGALLGALLWWNAYLPGGGLFRNLHLIILPAAMGVIVVALRNRQRQVGYFDPEVIAENKRGRV